MLAGHATVSCGRSILVATTSQLYAAATLVELDGVARRVILYPPDLSLDHLGFVADCAGVDVIVSDRLSNALDTIACVRPSSWTRLTPQSRSRCTKRSGFYSHPEPRQA